MTAIHHYWLKPAGGPPNTGAVFAWPCSPTKYFVQGTGTLLNTGYPNSIRGRLSGWAWDGGDSEYEPCELIMFRNAGELTAQSTSMGLFPRGQEWCIESRVGWASYDEDIIVVYPLRWSSGFYIKYTPSTRVTDLYVGTSVVQSHYSLTGLASNVLHHWAVTYVNGSIKVWVDGALRMTHSATVPDSASTGIVLRYENALYGELYVGGVRYWDAEHYTAQFIPPTQLTL